jgi:2-oxoglutarate dehydrogenase E2 component (dihydrolipoamide succinyltransferase)
MPLELKIPALGESITEVEIGTWLKGKGSAVQKDEPVVTLESEKATVELPAPASGILTEVLKRKGATAKVGEVIAYLEEEGAAAPPAKTPTEKKPPEAKAEKKPEAAKPAQPPRGTPSPPRAAAESELPPQEAEATDARERPAKEDVSRRFEEPRGKPPARTIEEPAEVPPEREEAKAEVPKMAAPPAREEEVVPMTRLRRTLAERLVQAQQTAALLTPFNEIDMSAVIALRKEHGEAFQKRYNVKLGFMSFFVKAAIDALKLVPQVNAEIRGTDIVYRNYYDIGVAVGGGKGLAVPVLRNAERMSFAEIETAIAEFARRAQENKLTLEELQGGTFTISNGGIYGSLLSTPIVNPPQSGILGLHAIQDRPVAREGNVVIRPMMYVALTYDHRIVDGREAVTFLKRIKQAVENPARMLVEV